MGWLGSPQCEEIERHPPRGLVVEVLERERALLG
jgi:hypothetical protein